jgi:excisionase family DNA binding protein
MDDKNRKDDGSQPDLLTVAEASALLRLKPSTIRAWLLARRIPFVKLGGRVFLLRSDCLNLIENNVVRTSPAASSGGL